MHDRSGDVVKLILFTSLALCALNANASTHTQTRAEKRCETIEARIVDHFMDSAEEVPQDVVKFCSSLDYRSDADCVSFKRLKCSVQL